MSNNSFCEKQFYVSVSNSQCNSGYLAIKKTKQARDIFFIHKHVYNLGKVCQLADFNFDLLKAKHMKQK